MANTREAERPQNETVLVAHVTVHLISGDSFELLPFLDDVDVKSRVTDLLDDWAKSGYLVRGSQIYPWQQVKLVAATSVTELSRHESEAQRIERQALDSAHLQQAFWKTKQPRERKQEGGQKEGQGNSAPTAGPGSA